MPTTRVVMLTKKDLTILNAAKHKTLISWWETLNTWDWPEKLSNKEKPIYNNVRNTRRGIIMDWIKNKVGLQAILRSHNSYMSKKEFKDFWRGIQGKSKKAFRRYIKRKQTQKYKKRMFKKCNKSLNLTLLDNE